MIEAFIGLKGYGKTLLMAERACRALSWRESVWSNIDIEDKVWKSKNKVIKLKSNNECHRAVKSLIQTTLCVDEVGIAFDNYRWQDLDSNTKYKMKLSRKVGLDFFYTDQYFQNVDVNLRRQTDRVTEAKFKLILPVPRIWKFWIRQRPKDPVNLFFTYRTYKTIAFESNVNPSAMKYYTIGILPRILSLGRALSLYKCFNSWDLVAQDIFDSDEFREQARQFYRDYNQPIPHALIDEIEGRMTTEQKNVTGNLLCTNA